MMSALEDDLLEQIRDYGLIEPERQHQFAKHLGRRWKFDLSWIAPAVAVEVDGGSFVQGAHGSGQGAENDAMKAAVATLLGWKVVRVTTHMVADGRALAVILGLLRVNWPEDAAEVLAGAKCAKCDLTKTRRNRKRREKARKAAAVAEEGQG
jgi:very-short-patch-repair endonuclease